jgi:hypothetical protein
MYQLLATTFLISFLASQFAFGSLAIKLCTRRNTTNFKAGTGVKFVVGQVLTGVIFSIFALASKFNETSILGVTLIGLVLALYFLPKKLKRTLKFRAPREYFSKKHFFTLTIVLLIATEQLIRLLSRPISDALAYYLVQPKLIALTNEMTPVNGYESFLQSSVLIEINNASVFTFAGEIGIRFYVLISGITLFRVVWEICEQLGLSQLSARFALFLMATSTFLTNTLADGKTDNLSTLWFMAGFSILISGFNHWDKKLFSLCGIILGFSLLSKVSFVVLGPALLYYFIVRIRKYPLRRKSLAYFHVSAGLSVPIFFNAVKNFIVFSDPLAPFISRYAEGSAQLFSQEWFSAENTKWIILSYPIALLFGQYPMQYGNLTPFLLVGIPFLFSIKSIDQVEKKTIKILAIMGATTVLVWLIFKPSIMAPRYISPAYIFLFMTIGCLISKNIERMRSVRLKQLMAIVIIGHLSLLIALSLARNDTTFYSGSQNPESLMYKHLSKVTGESGLVYLNTYNASMLDRTSLQCSSVIHPFTLQAEPTGGSSIWERLYEANFRFVLSDESTHKNLEVQNAPSALQSQSISVKAVHFSDVYKFYSITSTGIESKSKKVIC